MIFSEKIERMSNRGRTLGLVPPPSRIGNMNCCVPGCRIAMRRDNLKTRHYQSLVHFMPDGTPMPDTHDLYEALERDAKKHTKYFFDNGTNEADVPTISLKRPKPSVKANPFPLSKKHCQLCTSSSYSSGRS